MKYAVAYVSFFENVLKQVIVEADNPITALHDAVEGMTTKSDWLDGLCGEPHREDWSEQLEDICEAFFDCDSTVSVLEV